MTCFQRLSLARFSFKEYFLTGVMLNNVFAKFHTCLDFVQVVNTVRSKHVNRKTQDVGLFVRMTATWLFTVIYHLGSEIFSQTLALTLICSLYHRCLFLKHRA